MDVEGDSFYRYGERLCLVQVAWGGDVHLLDPLAENLGPWLSGIENVELIFHGADFDVRLLHARYGFHPRRVFDTMLAARILNIPKFGLTDLYEKYFGIMLEKKFQRADWFRRPLAPELLAYARKDVEHLEELSKRLREELAAAGRLPWHEEECAAVVARTIENLHRPADPDAWRVKGAGSLGRRDLSFLKELATARDEVARGRDLALFRVFSAEDLIRLARLAAHDPRTALARFPRALGGDLLKAFRAAIERAAVMPESAYPLPPAPGERPPAWLEKEVRRIGAIRDTRAKTLNLDPSFLASRAAIVRVAQRRPQSRKELAEALDSRWRAEVLADGFLNS